MANGLDAGTLLGIILQEHLRQSGEQRAEQRQLGRESRANIEARNRAEFGSQLDINEAVTRALLAAQGEKPKIGGFEQLLKIVNDATKIQQGVQEQFGEDDPAGARKALARGNQPFINQLEVLAPFFEASERPQLARLAQALSGTLRQADPVNPIGAALGNVVADVRAKGGGSGHAAGSTSSGELPGTLEFGGRKFEGTPESILETLIGERKGETAKTTGVRKPGPSDAKAKRKPAETPAQKRKRETTKLRAEQPLTTLDPAVELLGQLLGGIGFRAVESKRTGGLDPLDALL